MGRKLGTLVPLFEQLCCNGVGLPEDLEHLRPCQLVTELLMTAVVLSFITDTDELVFAADPRQ